MTIDMEGLAAKLSVKEIRSLLRQKEKDLARIENLKKRRENLLQKVKEVDEKMEQLSATVAGQGPRRRRQGKKRKGSRGGPTVGQLVLECLRNAGGEVDLAAIVSDVSLKRTGQKEATRSMYTAVGTAMRGDPAIKRVGRGVYRLTETGSKTVEGAGVRKGKKTKKKVAKAEGAKSGKPE